MRLRHDRRGGDRKIEWLHRGSPLPIRHGPSGSITSDSAPSRIARRSFRQNLAGDYEQLVSTSTVGPNPAID
ncbi:hypothetical protein [Azospirillum endophyticum]